MAANFTSDAWPAPQSAEPHSIPIITAGYGEGPNVIILSYRLNGYATELERTFFTSKPTEKMKKHFNHMLKAREIAFSMLKPGGTAADIDKAVRKYQFENGLEEYVIHRVGHGMGAFRYSHTVLITKDGYKILTESPGDIESLTVIRKIGLISKIKQNYIRKLIK